MERTMAIRGLCVAAALWTMSVAAFAQDTQPTGRLDGVVRTSGGKAVAGAIVWIQARNASPGTKFTAFQTAAKTAADGTFRANGIPDGVFAICPVPPDDELAAACIWERETIVTVSNGQAVSIPPIQLKPAVDLFVRVNDPKAKREAIEGKVAGADVLIAVRLPSGRILPIPRKAFDKNGADYHLAVPAETPFSLIAYSREFEMSDAAEKAIDKAKGLSTPITIRAGAKQHKEVLNIK